MALGIALAIDEGFPMAKHVAILLLLGFVAYGLSIYCYTYAQRTIGAALSFLLLGERLTNTPLPRGHRRNGHRLLAGRQKQPLIF